MAGHPQAKAAVIKVYEIINDIARLAGCTPKEIGEVKEWANIVAKAESRACLCATLEGETLFSALYGVYMLAFMDLKTVIKKITDSKSKEKSVANPRPEEGFQEQKTKRRSSTEEDRPNSAKKQGMNNNNVIGLKQTATITRNFFAPLEMDAEPETGGMEEEPLQRTGKDRPPPIIITSQVNLLKFQKEIKAITKGSFELRNTKHGTRAISREMADYLAIKNQLEKTKIHYYTFHLPPQASHQMIELSWFLALREQKLKNK